MVKQWIAITAATATGLVLGGLLMIVVLGGADRVYAQVAPAAIAGSHGEQPHAHDGSMAVMMEHCMEHMGEMGDMNSMMPMMMGMMGGQGMDSRTMEEMPEFCLAHMEEMDSAEEMAAQCQEHVGEMGGMMRMMMGHSRH